MDCICLSETDLCGHVSFHCIRETHFVFCIMMYTWGCKQIEQGRIKHCKSIRKIICYFKYKSLIWLQSSTCTWKLRWSCITHLPLGLFCNWKNIVPSQYKHKELPTVGCLHWFFSLQFQMFCNSKKWRSQSMTLQICWWFSMLLGLVKLKTREIVGSWSMKKRTGNNCTFPLCWKFQTVLGKKGKNLLSLLHGGGVLRPLGYAQL